jgi:hypothetical protein
MTHILIKVKIKLLLINEGPYKPIIATPTWTGGAIGEPTKDFAKSRPVCKVAAL